MLDPYNTKSRVLKIDVDLKLYGRPLRDWIDSRVVLLRSMGYDVDDVVYCYTLKGMHFWIHLKEPVDAENRCRLQFLLGDDHMRAFYNFYRLHLGVFDIYNALFSDKIREERRGLLWRIKKLLG